MSLQNATTVEDLLGILEAWLGAPLTAAGESIWALTRDVQYPNYRYESTLMVELANSGTIVGFGLSVHWANYCVATSVEDYISDPIQLYYLDIVLTSSLRTVQKPIALADLLGWHYAQIAHIPYTAHAASRIKTAPTVEMPVPSDALRWTWQLTPSELTHNTPRIQFVR